MFRTCLEKEEEEEEEKEDEEEALILPRVEEEEALSLPRVEEPTRAKGPPRSTKKAIRLWALVLWSLWSCNLCHWISGLWL